MIKHHGLEANRETPSKPWWMGPKVTIEKQWGVYGDTIRVGTIYITSIPGVSDFAPDRRKRSTIPSDMHVKKGPYIVDKSTDEGNIMGEITLKAAIKLLR